MNPVFRLDPKVRIAIERYCEEKFGVTPLWNTQKLGRPASHATRLELLRQPVFGKLYLWHWGESRPPTPYGRDAVRYHGIHHLHVIDRADLTAYLAARNLKL